MDLRRYTLLRSVISRWKDFAIFERKVFKNICPQASIRGDRHRLKYYFSVWKLACESIKHSRDIDDKVTCKMQDIFEWLQRNNCNEKSNL